MHAQGVAFPHSHNQTPHFGASPFGLPGAGGLPPGLLALQGVAAAAQQAFLKDEKGLCFIVPLFIYFNEMIYS
jgi:hypothetical protein